MHPELNDVCYALLVHAVVDDLVFPQLNQTLKWVWGTISCTLMIYLQYLGIDASALRLTAFTVERYIAICHSLRSMKKSLLSS